MSGTVTRTQKIWLFIALFHLALVMAGAASFSPDRLPLIGSFGARTLPMTNYYGQISGSSSNYAFFTPGVFGQLRAWYDVVDRDGETHSEVFRAGRSRESDLRMNDVIDQFINDFEDPMKFQRSLAASLAGSVFARFPGAQSVNIRIERLEAISREEYISGKQMEFTPVYSAKFVHQKVAGTK